MKKVFKFFGVFLAFVVGLFALVSCGNSKDSSSGEVTPSSGEESGGSGSGGSGATQIEYLNFISNGKVRVDIMNDNLGCGFTYGNEVVTNKKEMTYGATNTLGISGTLAVNSLNFVIVVEKETGYSFTVNKGIEKEYIEEYLSMSSKYANAKKIYIAISTGDVNWTKGLNTSMDAKINTYIVM